MSLFEGRCKNLVSGRIVAAILSLCCGVGSAQAALGGDAASVEADQAKMNASSQITAATGYAVHELRTSTGLTVREYMADGGKVFAITWQGPMLPNLRLLLGGYFDAYAAAARARHGGHGHLVVTQGDLVVESSGHMRDFFGRAYLSQQLPTGVGLADIQ